MSLLQIVGYAAATFTSGVTAAQLASQIQGNGITISNPVLRVGKASQAGTFTNGVAGAKLEIDQGILLTTMDVLEAFSTNSSTQTSKTNPGSAADSDLLAIDPRANNDTVVFEFDVTLGANTRLIMIDYQFASEEYNEWVGSQFNDAFGFFVSGGDLTQTYNVARVVDDSTIVTTSNIFNFDTVTVNNVNRGSRGSSQNGAPIITTNSSYFIDNCYLPNAKRDGYYDCSQNKSLVDVEFDGLTHRLHATLDNLTPGQTYHFKMAIADTSDAAWDTGVFVNKIQGIRGPQLCYDYAYKQNNQYITNKSYFGQTPRIDSAVFPNTLVPVSIYIKNLETSELTAQNLKMNINDINISQAIYQPSSITVIKPNSIVSTALPDNSNGMSVDDSYIHNALIGNLGSTEYFYFTYGLMPLTNDLDMPLNSTLSFDLSVQGVTIPYSYTLGSDKLPMCAGSVTYSASPGIYNMVDRQLNATTLNAGSTNVKYNLPTQVASRPTEMKIVSFDPNNLNTVKAANTVMAVELIDVGGYFDTNASCYDPNSAITQRAWVKFGNYDANTTNANFNTSLFGTGMNLNVSANDFYAKVRENMTYRLSYNLDDNNGSVQVETLANGKSKLKFFTTYAGQSCATDIDGNPNSQDTVPQWCGSNGGGGGTGMDADELRTCMECIFGLKTKRICSRDNFSTRPEAFNIDMKDPTNSIVVPKISNLAAGYNYRFDINATNHLNSNSTSGYVASFNNQYLSDRNVTFVWEPNGRIVNGCNNTLSPSLEFFFVDGAITNQTRMHSNVGRYELKARDKKWTSVDQTPMSHHNNATNWISGDDCNQSSNGSVSVYSLGKSYLENMVGCEISSNHFNYNAGIQYNDYNLTFKPYSFEMIGSFRLGEGNTTSVPPNIPISAGESKFLYMNDIGVLADKNMSLRGDYTITAKGANNATLSNFVNECYSEDVNLTLIHTKPNLISPLYLARFSDKNATNNAVLQDYDVNSVPVGETLLRTVDNSSFTKDGAGALLTEVYLDYNRNNTIRTNPMTVSYGNYGTRCTDLNECQHIANGITDHNASGSSPTGFNVTHFYGRAQGQTTRIRSPQGQVNAIGNTRIGFEVFCGNDGVTNCNPANLATPLVLPSGLLAPRGEDIGWYLNLDHHDTDPTNALNHSDQFFTPYGRADLDMIAAGSTETTANVTLSEAEINAVNGINVTATQTGFERFGVNYDGANGYPYYVRIQNNPSAWLIFNPPGDTNLLSNEFMIEFNKQSGWIGESTSGQATDNDASINTSRRIMW